MTPLAPVCSNCGASDFVWANDLKTGGLGGGSLSLRSRGELSLGTRICRACGHADLFLKDPSILRMPHTWRPGEFTPITPRPAVPPTHHAVTPATAAPPVPTPSVRPTEPPAAPPSPPPSPPPPPAYQYQPALLPPLTAARPVPPTPSPSPETPPSPPAVESPVLPLETTAPSPPPPPPESAPAAAPADKKPRRRKGSKGKGGDPPTDPTE